jgi:cell division protein FtsB
MRSLRSVWLQRLGVAALVALALGWVPYHLYGSSGLARYLKLKAERDALHETNLRMHLQNQRLRAELDQLSDDDGNLSRAAVERAARDELNLVKPGEVVFQIGEASGAAAPAATPATVEARR